MPGPARLVEWPWVLVEIECALCRRHGRYRLARLAERYGADIQLWALLTAIAGRCALDEPGVKPRAYEARCGIRYRVPAGGPRPEGVPAREAIPGETWPPRAVRPRPEPPPTVADVLRQGITHVGVHCYGLRDAVRCHHTATLAIADLGLPDNLPFPDIARVRRLRCLKCGARRAAVMALWPDQRGRHVGTDARIVAPAIPGVTPTGRDPAARPLPRPS